ncbi:MAG TPA: hypothetical protein PLS66_05430 [Tepiditoga sp.]|nr:hypothetical protein [Tepiditoga sp.]
MIIISKEKERKYILKKDKINELLEKQIKKEGLIQWYIDPEEGYDETRIRLVIENNPSGKMKKWIKTSKKKTDNKDLRYEKEESIEMIEDEEKKLNNKKNIIKIRYYICKNPEIIIDEFLRPYDKKYNNFDYKYLMEIEMKNEEKSFEEILKEKNLEEYIENEITGKISNKDIASEEKGIIKEIKYLENRLEGHVTVFMSPGTSIVRNLKNEIKKLSNPDIKEFIDINPRKPIKKLIKEISEKNIENIENINNLIDNLSKESVKDTAKLSAELSTVFQFQNLGFDIYKVVLFLVPPFEDYYSGYDKLFKNEINELFDKEKYPKLTESAIFIYYFLKKTFGIKNVEIEYFEENPQDIPENQKKLQEKIWQSLEKYDKNEKLIVDIAPGQKNISIMEVLYALFNKKSFYYKFQHAEKLVKFPAFGFDWDYAYLDEIIQIIESKKIDKEIKFQDYLNLPSMITRIYQKSYSENYEPFYPLDKIGNMYKSKREIPFGYGENLIKFLKNEDLIKYLTEGIKKKWSNMWIGDLIPETVEHSQRHSKRLMDFTVKLINIIGEDDFLPDISGNYTEKIDYRDLFYFLLITAMNVHDLGHTYANFYFDSDYNNEKKKIIVDKYPNLVRDLHNELTLSLIKEEKDFDILAKNNSFGNDAKKISDIFGEKTDEIIYAIMNICKYHRGYLPIDDEAYEKIKNKNEKKNKVYDIFGIDKTPLKNKLEKELEDKNLIKIILRASKWLKFIDGTDVQADRIITPEYNKLRKTRTKFEAIMLIEKYLIKYQNNKDNLITLKKYLENEDYSKMKSVKGEIKNYLDENLEKAINLYKNCDFANVFYNSEYEELSQIIFKLEQFEHFDKHAAVGAIYPIAFKYSNDENIDDACIIIEIIPNGEISEKLKKIKKDIEEDIAKELDLANLYIKGKKIKVSFK